MTYGFYPHSFTLTSNDSGQSSIGGMNRASPIWDLNVMTGLYGMHQKLIPPNTTFSCAGGYDLPGDEWKRRL